MNKSGSDRHSRTTGSINPAKGQRRTSNIKDSLDKKRAKPNPEQTLKDQTKLLNDLKHANEQLKALLREKYPDEVDQKYLGIWLEKRDREEQ